MSIPNKILEIINIQNDGKLSQENTSILLEADTDISDNLIKSLLRSGGKAFLMFGKYSEMIHDKIDALCELEPELYQNIITMVFDKEDLSDLETVSYVFMTFEIDIPITRYLVVLGDEYIKNTNFINSLKTNFKNISHSQNKYDTLY